MLVDFCEPSGFGALVFGVVYLVAGTALGAAAALATRKFAGPLRGWRMWGSGIVWFAAITLLARQVIRAMYGNCEMVAWGLAPGGAILAILFTSPAALMAYLLIVRQELAE